MSRVTVAPLDRTVARVVALRMRPADRSEIFATMFEEETEETLAALAASCLPCAWSASLDGEPVAVVGAAPMHPGVWQVFMYATDDFPRVAIAVTKFIRRCMIPAIRAAGAHRAQCLSAADHVQAHAWLRRLGAKREAVLRKYGRDGRDFYLYAWTA